MYISDRIELLIRENELSSSAFADRVGVQRSNISHILSGRNKPGLDLLQKILKNFPEVNANWLITGQGEVFQQAQLNSAVEIEKIIYFYTDGTFSIYNPKTR